jgi:hypothetical protein
MASSNTTIRPILYLAVGLVVGGAGAVLFRDSLPGEKGSPEERITKLEVELRRAQNRVLSLEGGRRSGRTVQDGLRELKESYEMGRLISPDDLLRTFQPWVRDLSPIFDRIRVRDEKRNADRIVGELTRKYDLTPGQQEALAKWFKQKAEDDAKRFSDLAGQPGTTLEDLMRETRDDRWDKGLDAHMESVLSGDKLANFKQERLVEKTDRVQGEADMRLARVDAVVNLDDGQREQVFNIMARGSPDYDPGMQLGGPVDNRNQEILTVLRPEQRQAWDAEKERRRNEAQAEMAEIGMTMPAGWDPLEDY